LFVLLAYCYSFVEFISSDNLFYSPQKEQNSYSKCSVFASFARLHLFYIANFVVFVDRGRKNVFYPRARGVKNILALPVIKN